MIRIDADGLNRQAALERQIEALLPNNGEAQVKLVAWLLSEEGFADVDQTKGADVDQVDDVVNPVVFESQYNRMLATTHTLPLLERYRLEHETSHILVY